MAPSPSLIDFGRKRSSTNPENEVDCDQDPTVSLRILSWLENVENNPDVYYGFDAETLTSK